MQIFWLHPRPSRYGVGPSSVCFRSLVGNSEMHSHLRTPALGWEVLKSCLLLE